jgi:hypothetical protein
MNSWELVPQAKYISRCRMLSAIAARLEFVNIAMQKSKNCFYIYLFPFLSDFVESFLRFFELFKKC